MQAMFPARFAARLWLIIGKNGANTMMLLESDFEKPRSPRGLRKFVCCRKKKIEAATTERHAAIQRKGMYNYFVKEIIPLSIFALKAYPNTCRVEPKRGKQGYDAIVRDNHGKVLDYVELTFPNVWEAEAKDAKIVVSQGFGKCDVYSPGENIERLREPIHDVCLNKAKNDYSDCTLVIAIDFLPPSKQFHRLYLQKIDHVLIRAQSIKFKAKRVFLLIIPFRKILKVQG